MFYCCFWFYEFILAQLIDVLFQMLKIKGFHVGIILPFFLERMKIKNNLHKIQTMTNGVKSIHRCTL